MLLFLAARLDARLAELVGSIQRMSADSLKDIVQELVTQSSFTMSTLLMKERFTQL